MGIDFILGEKKYVKFDIKSSIGQAIIVTSAKYTLSLNGSVIESGDCEIIEGNTLQLLLQPESKAKYDLEIEYEIPPEIRKVRCKVNVY